MALELQAIGVAESFKVKSPDLAALEMCLMEPAFVCSCRSARLAEKCGGGTFELLGPRRRLPSKVVSRRCMPFPRSCSLRSLRGGASSSLHYIVAAPPGRFDMSRGFLWSAWRKDVEAPTGRIGCHE
jgi:hypothetical protein